MHGAIGNRQGGYSSLAGGRGAGLWGSGAQGGPLAGLGGVKDLMWAGATDHAVQGWIRRYHLQRLLELSMIGRAGLRCAGQEGDRRASGLSVTGHAGRHAHFVRELSRKLVSRSQRIYHVLFFPCAMVFQSAKWRGM